MIVCRSGAPLSSPSDCPSWQCPIWPDEMASVAIGIFLQIVLMLRLSFPEWTHRLNLGNDLARPDSRRIDVSDRLFSDSLLFWRRIENSGSIAGTGIIALPIHRR